MKYKNIYLVIILIILSGLCGCSSKSSDSASPSSTTEYKLSDTEQAKIKAEAEARVRAEVEAKAKIEAEAKQKEKAAEEAREAADTTYRVTKDQYDRVQIGMTYDEVKSIMGSPGINKADYIEIGMSTTFQYDGTPVYTDRYQWDSKPYYKRINGIDTKCNTVLVIFQRNKVTGKVGFE